MRKNTWLRTIVLLAYMGFIFILSSIPGREIPSALSSYDKLIHFFLYLILGLIFTYFLSGLKSGLAQIMVGFATFFFIAIYGLSDEVHQTFTPGRTFELLDIITDVLGGVTGWLLFQFFRVIIRDRF
ncbi:MAG: VanZ family protein [Ignavibacteriales bacterium]